MKSRDKTLDSEIFGPGVVTCSSSWRRAIRSVKTTTTATTTSPPIRRSHKKLNPLKTLKLDGFHWRCRPFSSEILPSNICSQHPAAQTINELLAVAAFSVNVSPATLSYCYLIRTRHEASGTYVTPAHPTTIRLASECISHLLLL